MPRTAEEIISQAEQLAGLFEDYEPQPNQVRDATTLRAVRQAFLARAETEKDLAEVVALARDEGYSWASIGAMVGTSGEAARQEYGQTVTRR